jgi:hypothetical protein
VSGYVPCACRDCFEIAVSSGTETPTLCHACETAGCDRAGKAECSAPHAYCSADSEADHVDGICTVCGLAF